MLVVTFEVLLKPMISIRQIEVMRAVLMAGSVSGASRLLSVSPAAVSRMLRHTESQIGYALFERTSEGFVPRPEVRDLLEDLEAVHGHIERIQRRLSYSERPSEILKIGSSPGLGLNLVPRSLAEMVRRNPDSEFELGVLHVDEVLPYLEYGRYDFALTIYDLDDPRLRIRTLAQAGLVCVMAEDHPLAGRKSVTLEEISRHDLVGYDPQSFQQQLIDRLFSERGLVPRYRARCRLMSTAHTLSREHIGLTLLDRFTVFGQKDPGVHVATLDLDHWFPLNVVSLSKSPLSQSAEAYIDVLEKMID